MIVSYDSNLINEIEKNIYVVPMCLRIYVSMVQRINVCMHACTYACIHTCHTYLQAIHTYT